MRSDDGAIFVGLLIGGGLLIMLVALIGGLLQARRKGLLVHAERMKALELGREWPDAEATARLQAVGAPDEGHPARPASDKCYSVAGKAVFWGFVFAVGAANSAGHAGTAVAIAIAAATGAIGVTSVICGTILAARVPASAVPGYASAPAKGYYDPEGV